MESAPPSYLTGGDGEKVNRSPDKCLPLTLRLDTPQDSVVFKQCPPSVSEDAGFRVVPLPSASAPLAVGDIVAYEFVSTDRRWRWALGTVQELPETPVCGGGGGDAVPLTDSSTTTSVDEHAGVPTGQPPPHHLLVTVKDWVLSQKSGRPRRPLVQRYQQTCEVPPKQLSPVHTPPSDDHVGNARRDAASGEKTTPTPHMSQLSPAQEQRASVQYEDGSGPITPVGDEAAAEIAKAAVLVELAWDSVVGTEHSHWEEVLRMPEDTVPEVTRLTFWAFLLYAGLLPRDAGGEGDSVTGAAPTGAWRTIVDAMRHAAFADRIRALFLDTVSPIGGGDGLSPPASPANSAEQSSPASRSLSVARSTGSRRHALFPAISDAQRATHNYVKEHILCHSCFRRDDAVCAGVLTGCVYKWVESVARYFDSRIAAATVRQDEAVRKTRVATRAPELLTFSESTTRTTTALSSVFCKLEGVCWLRENIVLTRADIERLNAAAHRDRHEPGLPENSQSLAHTAFTLLLHAESAARHACMCEAAEAHSSLLQAYIANVLSTSSNERQCFLDASAVNGSVNAWERGTTTALMADDAAEADLLATVHRYAVDLETARYQQRRREADHLRALDALQTALNELYESYHSLESGMRTLVDNVGSAVDALVQDACETTVACQPTPLPDDMRAALREHFRDIIPRDAAALPPSPPLSCGVREPVPAQVTGGHPLPETTSAGDDLRVRETGAQDGHRAPAGTHAMYHFPADVETLMSSSISGCNAAEDRSEEGLPSEATDDIGSVVGEEAVAVAVSQLSPSTIAEEEATPRVNLTQFSSDHHHQHHQWNSDLRYEELERQEREIVRLTAMLHLERQQRERAEHRAEELERQSAPSQEPPPSTSVPQRSRSSGAPPSGERESPSHATGINTFAPADDDDDTTTISSSTALADAICDVHRAYHALHQRSAAALATADAALAELHRQACELESSLSAPDQVNLTAEEKLFLERRVSVVRRQWSLAQLEQTQHRQTARMLRTLKAAIARFSAAARFHDERWELQREAALGGGQTITSHVAFLPGYLWESCSQVHRCRMREAAVHDIATAAHVAESAIVLKSANASETGLFLNFDIAHPRDMSEECINTRLRQIPFRSLLDLYAHEDSPAEGSDALLNEVHELQKRISVLEDLTEELLR